jgi:UDP-sulfoquinovose synthase
MRFLVLGGDGFCGWPTSLHLSNRGHDVLIVDNLSRRDIDNEVMSLTPICSTSTRLAAWRQVSGREVTWQNLDVASDYDRLLGLLSDYRPDAVVHFAEQRAAPYSMKSARTKRYTVSNNLNATNNLLAAIVESGQDIHVVHLGTMGVYGYGTAGMRIPEGYLQVQVRTESGELIDQEILYPANPGSIYHMTKTQDQLLFAFYNKNDQVRVTDLHQGIVWGTQTEETKRDPRLVNRFDYDGDYGTVLNRFLMQAAIGYPLTVHGTGGQTRAFIHIQDTVRCVELALATPPDRGERVRILNQMTEIHRVIDLAKLVAEAAENDLHVENSTFIRLGLKPTTLADGLLREITEIARGFSDRCDPERIPCRSTWRPAKRTAATAGAAP